MKNIKLCHKFLHTRSGRSLKKKLSGVVLVLLVTPVLAAEQKQGNELTLGGGVEVIPRYSGSNESRVTTAQVMDYAMVNGFFFSTTRGIGYNNNIGRLEYSAALSYRAGRKDRDVDSNAISYGSDDLRGMGDIKGSVIGVPGLQYEVTDWLNVRVQAELPISQRDNGEALHFGIFSPLYTSSKNSVTLALTSSWGTSKYMQTYYGVSASQSAATGFTRHDAGSGIYAYSLNIDWVHKLNRQWCVVAATGFTQLTGDARNSPIVQRKASSTGSLMVTYRF